MCCYESFLSKTRRDIETEIKVGLEWEVVMMMEGVIEMVGDSQKYFESPLTSLDKSIA